MSNILDKLRMIQEGEMPPELAQNEPLEVIGNTDVMVDLDVDELDDDFLAEVNLAILKHEAGIDADQQLAQMLNESGEALIRDGILTENVMTKSYIALSPLARRQKAVSLLKLKMAKEAGDPRYARVVKLRKLWKRLLKQIREDSRYKKAETIIRKQQFRLVQNPEAMAAAKRAKSFKLK